MGTLLSQDIRKVDVYNQDLLLLNAACGVLRMGEDCRAKLQDGQRNSGVKAAIAGDRGPETGILGESP